MKLLESVLRLDPERLEALAARWNIPLDPKKRLTVAEQVARGLVLVPRWLEPKRLNEREREAVRLLAAAPKGLLEDTLPAAIETLIEDGLLYRDPGRRERVYMPAAFRLQLPSSPSDSPRAARVLLQSLNEEAARELCQQHLKRLPPLPWPMLLETVLERLEDVEWVRAELSSLDDAERSLLWAIDAVGGEVNGEEVLELSREPARIAHGGSVRVPRRSAIFGLARRGLVITRAEGWLIPDEVERLTGRERRGRAGIERQRLLMSRHTQDLTPSRAHLAVPPGPLSVGLMAALASLKELPAEGRGLSKVSVRKVSQLLHVDPQCAEFLLCLARAEGLFSSHVTLHEASQRLVAVWRRGGAWDEAAIEPDSFRPGHPRTSRTTQLIREALLDTLALLPVGEFALVSDVQAVCCTDRRAIAAQRGLTRAVRAGQEVRGSVLDVLGVLLEHSLPALGLIDVGEVELGPVLRLSQLGRRWLEQSDALQAAGAPAGALAEAKAAAGRGRWLGSLRLSCGAECESSAVVEVARFGEVWLDDQGVGIALSDAMLTAAADHDPDFAGLRAGLAALGLAPTSELEAALERVTAQKPMCALLRTAAFVAIEDAGLREAVYRDKDAVGLWAAPPLSEGLLVKPGVSAARVHEVLARHGARLLTD